MSQTITISLDAMGGDAGPEVVIGGASIILDRRPDLRFAIFGEEDVVRPVLDAYPRVRDVSAFHHCDVTVQMDDKPSQALRKGRWKSSMWRTVQAVRDGEAGAAVSAGNTGALMAMAKFCLKPLPGIERPAIAAIWPTLKGESIVLDVGATIGADQRQLVDFAVMGAAMARSVFGLERPTVGLLNVGVEEIKGIEEVREAGRILKEMNHPSFEYRGFIEGGDLGKGTVDVAVTEGFAGNIALKTAEGTARQIGEYLRSAIFSPDPRSSY
jgi:glycerol-3-phosphate acyltransferase PlsX